MSENPLLRILFFPLSMLYGFGILLRNYLYEKGWLKSIEFDFPVICVGNLSVGGTGKTSHIEFLVRMLSPNFRVAILSRGYQRKKRGYLDVQTNSTAEDVGDEPAMMKKKYPNVAVAVCEERADGVPQMLSTYPETDVVLLDDAFQHRSVRAGLNILLTSYDRLLTRDQILPLGTLREFKSAAQRAEFIVVTKCPPELSVAEKEKIKKEIAPLPGQLLFFSKQDYQKPYLITDSSVRLTLDKNTDVLLFCGIAFPETLIQDLKTRARNVYTRTFPDHHAFDRLDIESITETFQNLPQENTVLITTEKDAVKLHQFAKWIIEKKLPIFVLPVEIDFFEEDRMLFETEIVGWLKKLKEMREEE